MRIFKYEVLPGINHISLPRSSQVLSTGIQEETIFVWILISDSSETESREIFVTGTGHEINDELAGRLNFLGTVFAGDFVWHVFQRC